MNPHPLVLAFAMSVLGCRQEAADATPEAAVEAFIERMRAVHGDPRYGEKALALLWTEGRLALEERAARATAAAGRPVAPAEMLVPSRFSLRFEPRRVSVDSKGQWARVTLFGDAPGAVAEVACVREAEGWRVVIDLPALSPIERRGDDSP